MSTARIVLLLIAVSLALRVGLVLIAAGPQVRPLYDEGEYLRSAKAFARIYADLARFEPPAERDVSAAYGRGWWPPGHAMLLGTGLLVFGDSTVGARLTVAVTSALTTGLVFLLTLALAARPAALAAAILHLLHPTFLAFSHYLWSETTFIALLLLALIALVRATGEETTRPTLWALMTGIGVGLMLVTRAAALPLLVVMPAWIVCSGRGSRASWLRGGLALVVALLVIAPWQLQIQRREGEFIPLSTAAPYNLVLETNPWPGTEGGPLRRQINQRAREIGGTTSAAARSIAIETIVADPVAYAAACVRRARTLWDLDTLLLRHVLIAIYPPVSGLTAWLVLAASFGSLLLVTGLVVAGVPASWPSRGALLLLVMIVALAVGPVLTVTNSRMGIPILALLLPLAGLGAVRLQGLAPLARALVAAAIALAAANSLTVDRHDDGLVATGASSHFRAVVPTMDRLFGTHTPSADCVQVRAERDILLSLPAEYRFKRGAERERRLKPDGAARLEIVGRDSGRRAPAGQLELLLRTPGSPNAVSMAPVRPDTWQRWRDTELPGVSVLWCGGRVRPSGR